MQTLSLHLITLCVKLHEYDFYEQILL